MTETTRCGQSALALACSWPVVRRALGYGLVVGFVLASINHGDCFVHGHFGTDGCWYKSILTACVPYVVSTLSSVQALLSAEAECAGEWAGAREDQ